MERIIHNQNFNGPYGRITWLMESIKVKIKGDKTVDTALTILSRRNKMANMRLKQPRV